MVPRLRHMLLGSLLAACFVGAPACKPGADSGAPGRTDRPGKTRRGPRLPDPFPLPAEPLAILHVESPAKLIEDLRTYTDRIPPDPELAAAMLDGIERKSVESKISGAVALDRPWTLVHTSGEAIVAVPIRDDKLDAVAQVLAMFPAEGKFGAVALPAADAPPEDGRRSNDRPPAVAWLDRDGRNLYFAETLRGLATGPELANAYGEHAVRIGFGKALGEVTGDDFPFERLELVGEGISSFEARLRGLDRQEVPQIAELSNGALTGMLTAPQVAWGVSTRWSGHEEAVGTIISEATLQVREQNFLVRGVLEDLLRKVNAVLRAWNGRVMLGSGPANHVLLALGTDDTARAERAVLHLVRGVLDNLKLADTFGLEVPKLSLKKAVQSVGDTKIHQISLAGASEKLPGELAPLLDDGRLRIAIAFPAHAASALIVTGPTPVEAAVRWVKDSRASTREHDGLADLAAASFAVTPESLRPVVESGSPLGAIGVSADRPPTIATLRSEGGELVLRVRQAAGK